MTDSEALTECQVCHKRYDEKTGRIEPPAEQGAKPVTTKPSDPKSNLAQIEIDGKQIPKPANLCDDCLKHIKFNRDAQAVAFFCPTCQLGGYCHIGIGIWSMCFPTDRVTFAGIINQAMLANGLVTKDALN